MKRFIALVCLTVILGSLTVADAFTITGHSLGGQTFPIRLKFILGVPLTFDTVLVTIAIPGLNTYTLSGVPEGGYILFSYQDLNTNLTPDLDEPRGFYGGQMPTILNLSSDSSGIDIQLQPPNSGGFTGQLLYNGALSGTRYVQAFRSPAMEGIPNGLGFVLDTTGQNNYTCFVDSFGTYYAMAFMDLNRNFQFDPDEPMGVYGGETPAAINVQQDDFPDNIDITLLDPSAVDPERPSLPQSFTLNAVYPNPFNSLARVSFSVSAPSQIAITLYDVLGRSVREIARNFYAPGSYQVTLNGRDLPTGVYLLALQGGSQSAVAKVLLLK
jgi:hypothetical protein